MSNIEKLLKEKDKNCSMFAETILTFMKSQGFYGHLYEGINAFDNNLFNTLVDTLKKQNFKDIVDVVLWLES